MDNKLIVVAYAIIRQGNKIILTNEKDREGWKLPGGWVEWGESFEQTAKREIEEEVGGKNVIIENFVGIWQHFGDKDHRIVVVLSGKIDESEVLSICSPDIVKIELVDIESGDLRKESNFFKKRFYQPVQNYLEGKVYPIELIRFFTWSQQ